MPVYTISDIIDCFDVGASEIDEESNEIRVQLKGQGFSEEDENDAEDINDAPVFGALGVTSMPYPADETGKCQMIGHRLLECTIAARDTRSAAVIGQLQPGETCIHSTEPEHNARIYLKANKQSVMMSKDSSDKDMLIILDGAADQLSISAFKQFISLDKSQGITLATEGAYLNIGKEGTITIFGNVVIQGKILAPAVQVAVPGITPGPGATVGTLI